MKTTVFFTILSLSLLLAACSSNSQEQTGKETNTETADTNGGNQPQTIQENRSIISAEVLSVDVDEMGDFTITAKVLTVESDGSLPSMAVVDETYELIPNYVVDEDDNRIDNDRNRELAALKDLSPGDTIKASVFLALPNNWFIYQPLQ